MLSLLPDSIESVGSHMSQCGVVLHLFTWSFRKRHDTEACARRILEFPLSMDAREVAKELKGEGWYARESDYSSIIFRIERVRAKAGT